MSKKSKKSPTAALSKAKLTSLAEKMVEQMNDGTITVPHINYDFMWYDLDRFRIQWQEYCEYPEDYDFFSWLDAVAEEKGWPAKRVAALKKSARPTNKELAASVGMDGEDGYEYFCTAMVQEIVDDGETVGLALLDIFGGGGGGPEFYLLGAFSTREQLDAYAQKNGMSS